MPPLLLLFSSIDKVYCNITRRKKEWNKWLSDKLKLVNKVISYRVNGYWLHLCMFWKYFILQDLILLRIVVSAYPSVTWLKTILVILWHCPKLDFLKYYMLMSYFRFTLQSNIQITMYHSIFNLYNRTDNHKILLQHIILHRLNSWNMSNSRELSCLLLF